MKLLYLIYFEYCPLGETNFIHATFSHLNLPQASGNWLSVPVNTVTNNLETRMVSLEFQKPCNEINFSKNKNYFSRSF